MKNIALIDEKIVKDNLINLRQIVFEVTEKCNLNCTYCGLSDLYKKMMTGKPEIYLLHNVEYFQKIQLLLNRPLNEVP